MLGSKTRSKIRGIDKLYINGLDYDEAPIISCTLEPELERVATEEWFKNICLKNYMLVISVGIIFHRNRVFLYDPERGDFSRKRIKKRYRKLMYDIYKYIEDNDIDIGIDVEVNFIYYIKIFFRSIRNFISDLGYSNVWGKSNR